MKFLTFAYDVQLNDNEDYIKEGTQVEVYPHWKNNDQTTYVIITEAYSYSKKPLKVNEVVSFMNCSFIEYQA